MHSDVIQRLAEAFRDASKELYLVGGTVRDELLGRPSHDIDMATNALPEEIKEIIATTQPMHVFPVGEKFGTIQVHYPGYPDPEVIEITTYRGERYTQGSRKPEVQFGTSIYEDLRRRDFTMNAIALNPLTGNYIDVWYGRKDINLGMIRAVEDPVQRFQEDPLRMLRAIRLASQLDFIIAQVTGMAIAQQAHELQHISQERIRDEFSKILLSSQSIRALEQLLDYGLFALFLPEMEALVGVEQQPHHSCDVFDHTTLVVRRTPARLEVRLAALLHDIAKPLTRTVDAQGVTHFYGHEDLGAEMAATILRRLRFGNEMVERVSKMVKLHMRVNAYTERWSTGAVRRLYVDAEDVLDDLLDLAIADGISDRDEPADVVRARIEHLRTRMHEVSMQAVQQPLVSPLNGEELMALFGRGPGPWLRPIKQHLHDLVLDGVLQSDDKESARDAARAFQADVR